MPRTTVAIVAFGLFLNALSVHAQSEVDASERQPASKNGSSEGEEDYHFKWLDPEKKVYVLQNRKFLKAKKFLISLMGGSDLTAPYRTVYALNPRLTYYFTEAWGVEAFFAARFNSENSTFEQLTIASPDALPVVRENKFQTALMGHWAPWYAKINVFNRILYFDWYFSAGLGMSSFDLDRRRSVLGERDVITDSRFTAFLGTGHHFHLSQLFLLRLDFTSSFYRAPNLGDVGEETWFSNFNFYLGAAIKL